MTATTHLLSPNVHLMRSDEEEMTAEPSSCWSRTRAAARPFVVASSIGCLAATVFATFGAHLALCSLGTASAGVGGGVVGCGAIVVGSEVKQYYSDTQE